MIHTTKDNPGRQSPFIGERKLLLQESLRKLQNTSFSRAESFWFFLGYAISGPLLLGFGQFIYNHFKRGEADRWHFLARDGMQIFRAFLACKSEGNNFGLNDDHWLHCDLDDLLKNISDLQSTLESPPESTNQYSYLLTSRRALNFAAITCVGQKSTDFLISDASGMSVRDFLKRINIHAENHLSEIKESGLASGSHIITAANRPQLKKLIHLLETPILNQSEIERKAYLDYLHSMGHPWKRVALVDIGWHASSQCSFEALLADSISSHERCQWNGYYFGTLSKIQTNGKTNGFFFEEEAPVENFLLIKECIEIVELLFSNTTQTLEYISTKNEQIDFHFLPDNNNLDRRLLLLMETGALRYINDFFHSANSFPALTDLYACLAELLLYPSEASVAELSRVRFTCGFGNSQGRNIVAHSTHSFRFKKIVSGYRGSFWRRAYIQRLNLIQRLLLKTFVPSSRKY